MSTKVSYRFRLDRANLPMKRVRDVLRVWRSVGKQYRQEISEVEKRISRGKISAPRSYQTIEEAEYERLRKELAVLYAEVDAILGIAGLKPGDDWEKAGGIKLNGIAKMLAQNLLLRLT